MFISFSQTASNSNTNTSRIETKVLTYTFDHWLYYPIFIAFTSAHFWIFSTHRVQIDKPIRLMIFPFSMCLSLAKGCNNNKLVKLKPNRILIVFWIFLHALNSKCLLESSFSLCTLESTLKYEKWVSTKHRSEVRRQLILVHFVFNWIKIWFAFNFQLLAI